MLNNVRKIIAQPFNGLMVVKIGFNNILETNFMVSIFYPFFLLFGFLLTDFLFQDG